MYPNGVTAVAGVDLTVADGEFMVLVGPSGCGKTTLLRMIAGLEEITSGTLRIGDRIVNDVVPKDRDIAMVFQSYALYPHMTVEQNIGFALKLQQAAQRRIRAKVRRGRRRCWGSAELLEPQAGTALRAASVSGWRWAGRSSASRRRS